MLEKSMEVIHQKVNDGLQVLEEKLSKAIMLTKFKKTYLSYRS